MTADTSPNGSGSSSRPSPIAELHAAAGACPVDLGDGLTGVSYPTDFEHAESPQIFDLNFWTAIQIRGKDATSFLHAMTTAALKGAQPSRALHTAFLNDKGRVLGHADLLPLGPSGYLALGPAQSVSALSQSLERFLFSEDVSFGPTDDPQFLIGLSAPARLHDALGEPASVVPVPQIQALAYSLPLCRTRPMAVLCVSASGAVATWNALIGAGFSPSGLAVFNWLSVLNGFPLFPVDAGPETIVLETPLEKIITTSKGCYPGQETVERVSAKGQTQWTWAILKNTGLPAKSGSLFHRGEEVGSITRSSAGPQQESWSLARLRREHCQVHATFRDSAGATHTVIQAGSLP